MKKDIVYTIRMNSRIRDLLKMAAEKDRRTMASLIDTIFHNYLEKERFLTKPTLDTETRKHARKGSMLPVKTLCMENDEKCFASGVVINISKGGAMLLFPKGFGIPFESDNSPSRFKFCVESPKSREEVWFDCETRHWEINDHQIRVGTAFVDPKQDVIETVSQFLV